MNLVLTSAVKQQLKKTEQLVGLLLNASLNKLKEI